MGTRSSATLDIRLKLLLRSLCFRFRSLQRAEERERELLASARERDKQFEVFTKKLEVDLEEKDKKFAEWAAEKEAEIIVREKAAKDAADKQIESIRR